jgi:hypothetical protein
MRIELASLEDEFSAFAPDPAELPAPAFDRRSSPLLGQHSAAHSLGETQQSSARVNTLFFTRSLDNPQAVEPVGRDAQRPGGAALVLSVLKTDESPSEQMWRLRKGCSDYWPAHDRPSAHRCGRDFLAQR